MFLVKKNKVKGLPFNRYSWLTTHNSFAISGSRSATGSIILAPTNQEDSVTNQLKVRLLVYYYRKKKVLRVFLIILCPVVMASDMCDSVGASRFEHTLKLNINGTGIFSSDTPLQCKILQTNI